MTSRHVIEIPKKKQTNLFTDTEADQPWTKTDHVKRYHLSFPFYPFRTLCPRALDQMLKSSESDSTSPLIPANTQLNFVFHKRKKTNFLQNMIIFNLNETLGTDRNTLTEAQFNAAVKITLPEGNPVANVDYSISKVDIKVQAMYLQVSFCEDIFLLFLFINFLLFLDCTNKIQRIITRKTFVQRIQQLSHNFYTHSKIVSAFLRY